MRLKKNIVKYLCDYGNNTTPDRKSKCGEIEKKKTEMIFIELWSCDTWQWISINGRRLYVSPVSSAGIPSSIPVASSSKYGQQ